MTTLPTSCCPLDQVVVSAELHGFSRAVDQLEGAHHHDDAGRVRSTSSGVVYAAFSTRFIRTCESWLASNGIFPHPLLLTLAQAGLEQLDFFEETVALIVQGPARSGQHRKRHYQESKYMVNKAYIAFPRLEAHRAGSALRRGSI